MSSPNPSTSGLALSKESRRMRPNAIRALIGLVSKPGIVSFAGGVPSPATFPRERLAEIASRLILDEGDSVLQYGTTRGNAALVSAVAERLRRRGVAWAEPDGVLLTSGSQQGLDLVARVLVDPGDVVFVELPSYIGGLASLWAAGAELVGVRLTDRGVDLDDLERRVAAARAAGRTARVLYTIPTFQNPSGITADAASRAALYAAAERLDLTIVEDDPYGEVYFDDRAAPPPPIATLDTGARVIYLGSLSKVLCPGLRAAWTVASPALARRLELAKEAADLCSSSLDHAIAGVALAEGLVDDRLPEIRRFYAERCRAMLDALAASAPEGVSWTRPGGGLFVWVTLPEGVDARERLDAAVEAGVAYVPGAPFFVDGGGANTLRLAFSKEDPDTIARGVATLVGVLGRTNEG
jgi:2-aminoadipate transaminase